MPPRKSSKETVIYPASRHKTPSFKPLRPSRREPSSTSEPATGTSPPRGKGLHNRGAPARKRLKKVPDDDDADDAIAFDPDVNREPPRPRAPRKPSPRAAAPQRPPARISSPPLAISSDAAIAPSPPASTTTPAPVPSQSDTIPTIPDALLTRLLHEHFARPSTTIDTRALPVLQKYFEVFVREAIARCSARKAEGTPRGGGGGLDMAWLELEDLEKVAAGMVLDF